MRYSKDNEVESVTTLFARGPVQGAFYPRAFLLHGVENMAIAKQIPFTQKLLFETFTYDEGKLLWKVCRISGLIGKEAGTVRPRGYRHIKFQGGYYLRHRLVYLMFTGQQPPVLDHINGIPGDDRIENIQPATTTQNIQKAHRKASSSGAIGVYWNKRNQKWFAHIKVEGKDRHLGSFKFLNGAIEARKKAEEKYFGKFKPTNDRT